MPGKREMSVAAVQLRHRYGDVAGALARLDVLLRAVPAGTDLVVLPEASLTGYVSPAGDFDLARFAEPRDGPTVSALCALAQAHGVALVGPLIERDGARVFNAVMAVGADGGVIGVYRKRHPWHPEEWATPGAEDHPVWSIAGHRVTAAVCYDVHFLAREGAAALRESEVLVFPSAWCEAPPDSRPRLLGGIARRFGVTVVNANWARGRPALWGQGGSAVYGPDGAVTAEATGEGEEVVGGG